MNNEKNQPGIEERSAEQIEYDRIWREDINSALDSAEGLPAKSRETLSGLVDRLSSGEKVDSIEIHEADPQVIERAMLEVFARASAVFTTPSGKVCHLGSQHFWPTREANFFVPSGVELFDVRPVDSIGIEMDVVTIATREGKKYARASDVKEIPSDQYSYDKRASEFLGENFGAVTDAYGETHSGRAIYIKGDKVVLDFGGSTYFCMELLNSILFDRKEGQPTKYVGGTSIVTAEY